MSPVSIIAIVALCGYAVYRQSIRHEIQGGANRFKMAFIYGGIALLVGGFSRPDTGTEWGLLAASLAASVIVGSARGRLTHVWREADGKLWCQGTPLTIGLFLAMVAFKFALGTWAYFHHISDDGGFGEILIMIAIMIAFQAQLVWLRAAKIGPAPQGGPSGVRVGV